MKKTYRAVCTWHLQDGSTAEVFDSVADAYKWLLGQAQAWVNDRRPASNYFEAEITVGKGRSANVYANMHGEKDQDGRGSLQTEWYGKKPRGA